ncbi:MAG: CapA family protein, partial [Caldilineaceae bacterium]|nr:CapA family protein [Caldilineaceae bacterium]
LNRLGAIRNQIEEQLGPGLQVVRAGVRRVFAAGRAVEIREAAANLRSPSRLLVTVLLGFAGVAAATSIASFASGTQGVGEIGTVSATQMQPAAQQPDSRDGWLTVALDTALPERYFSQLLTAAFGLEEIESGGMRKKVILLDQPRNADVQIGLAAGTAGAGSVLYTRYLAPVAPFATVQDEVSMAELTLRWQGRGSGPLIIDADYVSELEAVFGEEAADSVQTASGSALPSVLEVTAGGLAIVPFEGLTPVLKVMRLNGANILSNTFDEAAYPLTAVVSVFGSDSEAVAAALRPQITEPTNRRPDELTTLIMTGVTAMARVTAARMEAKGYVYPSQVISPTLRAADITHISNEVPFLAGCDVDPSLNNMILCSSPAYWAALEALGTDIVGLSGNHVNDFGQEGARESIGWYRENGIPIYGSGLNEEEACAPLLFTHNGNRFAFLAALAHYPSFAWATEHGPGACDYNGNKAGIFARIAALRDEVDVIAVELQHEEIYNPAPIFRQVQDFRELRAAGADIVTGVQSHVPQAMEPYGYGNEKPGIIVYGLGNLFFDQMWSWQTRTSLIARHTIHDGKVISTEILTAVLEDYAQPRWTTEVERADLLRQIFDAAPAR